MAGRGAGGAEAAAANLIANLHKAGIEQIIVKDKQASGFVLPEKLDLKLAPRTLASPIPILQKFSLAWLIRREKPALIHVWTRHAAGLLPRKCDIPIVAWFGSYDDPRPFHPCTDFIGATKGIVAHIIKNGLAAEHVFLVPNFTHFPSLPPIDRTSLATPKDAKVLLTLSRLHPTKGLDSFLKALATMPDCYGWIEGEGPIKRELEALAIKLGIMDRVRFLGKRADRAALLRAADVCVLPSRHEPFGTIALESWSAGTPLVACQNDGIAALVEDGLNGLLVPLGDTEKLAAALRRALTDTSLRQRLIAQGYAAYIKDYTAESLTRQWLEIYRRLTVTSPQTARSNAN